MPLTQTTRRTLHAAAIGLVALLVLANLAMIFGFSTENREESGSRSRAVAVVVARVLYADFEDLPVAEQEAVVDSLHGAVRKTAHFLEFALLGCLTASLIRLIWLFLARSLPLWQTAGIPSLFCLLTAACDETLQIFTGRGPAVRDVLIDFAGALSGVLFLHLAVGLISAVSRARRRKQRQKEELSA
jgi:VanZ family protein